MTTQVTQEDIYESLKSVFDPEIPVNVVDLGLIYDVQVTEGDVYVQMPLTFPGCGMGPYIAQQAEWPSRNSKVWKRLISSWSSNRHGRPT